MRSYGIEINKDNYQAKSTKELEHAIITCDTNIEDGLFGLDIFKAKDAEEAQELKPLIEAELRRRKN